MTTISSWADLPTELLVMIAKCLKSHIYICAFRSVCSSWRSSAVPFKVPLQFPFDLPLLPVDYHVLDIFQGAPAFFHLNQKAVYFLEPVTELSTSLDSWFIVVEELEGAKVHLLMPFTGKHMESLPPNFPKEFNLSNFRITELQKLYQLESEIEDSIYETDYFEEWGFPKIMVRKVVLLSSQTHNEFELAVLQADGTLSFFKLATEKWIQLGNVEGEKIDDIALYKGNKVCAMVEIYDDGEPIIIDSSLNLTRIGLPKVLDDGMYHTHYYLVESFGDLLLVEENDPASLIDSSLPKSLRSGAILLSYKVYKLQEEEEEHRWIEVTDLGHRVIILSKGYGSQYWALSLPSAQIPRLRNCIVYTDNLDNDNLKYVFVFNMETSVLGECLSFLQSRARFGHR